MALTLDGTNGISASSGVNVLQDDSVVTGNLVDGAVTDAKIAAMAASKLTGDVAAARITDALNASGSAPVYACRAWVNFNGTGTVAIRASGNVSSITDNGTGFYTVNFTTAMSDANYCATCDATPAPDGNLTSTDIFGTNSGSFTQAPTTSSYTLYVTNRGTTAKDSAYITSSVFR
jgi:hypothetical protein